MNILEQRETINNSESETQKKANIQHEKQNWLKRLEQESWQAELIISGIAIYGSMQLPNIINNLADIGLGILSPDLYKYIYYVFIYLNIGASVLTVSFILHFVLRAMWVGMIGLNSVFPVAVNKSSSVYPPHLIEGLKKDFPESNESAIYKLDDFCSLIFAFCGLLVLTFTAFNIDILAVIAFKALLGEILPPLIVDNIVLAIIAVASIFVLAQTILGIKYLHKYSFVQKYHYPFQKALVKILYNFFYRPITRLSITFITNLRINRFIVSAGFALVLIIFITGYLSKNSPAANFKTATLLSEKHAQLNNYNPEHYENQRTVEHGRARSAFIQSMYIKEKFLKVYVPVFFNEQETISLMAKKWDLNFETAEHENDSNAKSLKLKVLERYHRFYINDSLYNIPVRYYSQSITESGVLAFIPLSHLGIGEHLLKVEKIGLDSNSVNRTMLIPFIKIE